MKRRFLLLAVASFLVFGRFSGLAVTVTNYLSDIFMSPPPEVTYVRFEPQLTPVVFPSGVQPLLLDFARKTSVGTNGL